MKRTLITLMVVLALWCLDYGAAQDQQQPTQEQLLAQQDRMILERDKIIDSQDQTIKGMNNSIRLFTADISKLRTVAQLDSFRTAYRIPNPKPVEKEDKAKK